ncbi:asparagine synthase (glutamine-hydrolyzing) [Halarcobacter sp.]|uniref:asparagine synthase (glutamine-hydrolyzing) n=1 Tax=Halarcobacter sp. TaxID=2321133 RepID=UPI003B00E932
MCGISGILVRRDNKVRLDEIKKMNDLIIHRGPDDEGIFLEENLGFGHRRLSILDLSSDGHQPMSYLDRYVITYNGEVYNYLEIREELEKDGYSFKSHTDTEVIIASYDKWGEECVNKFNGMWAFAIYDRVKQNVFCSRDRFGIKPFYYAQIEDKFIFASEIKQLLPFFSKNIVNKKILLDYLIIGFEDHTNETFFKDIYKLEQSHNLVYDLKANSFEIRRYFEIKNYKENLSESESVKLYENNLKSSINLRLRSDVKVGTCLSGGLDSSSLAALSSLEYNKKASSKFTAIHAKSTQKNNDESLFAKEVSNHCNLDLNIVEPSSKEFIENIDEVIYTQEEPFGGPSIFMQYFVMKKAKEIGCTVMLDGQGGDEILLGYERYYPAYLMSLQTIEKFTEFINSSKNSKLSILQLIQYFFYFTNYKIRLKRLKSKNSFLKLEVLDDLDESLLKQSAKSYLSIFDLQCLEIYKTQMPHLLRYEDKNSMKCSIETRLPFIDYNVLQSAISINNKYKIKSGWTKYILRKTIEKVLPENIVWRKNKFGFEAPSKTWLDTIDEEMKNSVENSILISTISNKFDWNHLDKTQKWRLFNISKWENIYNVTYE